MKPKKPVQFAGRTYAPSMKSAADPMTTEDVPMAEGDMNAKKMMDPMADATTKAKGCNKKPMA